MIAQGAHQPMDYKLRVYFTQEMHTPALAAGASVIRHDFFQTFFHAIEQYRATILGTSDHMIFAGIDDMPFALVFWSGHIIRTYELYYKAIIYRMQAFSPHGL